MRILMCLVACAALLSNTYAEDNKTAERSRRVKVALALSAAHPALAADGCGVCLDDETDARTLARAQNKPLVLFVGGCGGSGESAVDGGAVACRVKAYADDAKPRVVVLAPIDGGNWTINATLDCTAKVAEIRKAVADAKPAAKASPVHHEPMDWFAGDDHKPALTPVPAAAEVKVKRYRQVCRNGVCMLEEIVE